ncbi:MAG: porin [Polyangiaceae bacterium]
MPSRTVLHHTKTALVAVTVSVCCAFGGIANAQTGGGDAPANRLLTAVAAIEAPAADTSATTWTAGYHNGTFFLRDKSDIFRLYVMGRAHADWLDQLGAGVTSLPPGNNLTDGFFLRRARIELAGEFYEKWQFWVGAETASATSIDDAAANQVTPTCTAAANSFLTCSNRSNVADAPTVKAIPTDVFVNYGPTPWTNLQAGQFYLPFSLENRISDNTTWFLERSLPIRNIGAPLQRDIGLMFWGESPDRSLYYAVGILNGDGPNRPNVDSRYDVSARAVYRPFAASTDTFSKWVQVGVSARQGSRDPAKVGYDLPSLTTQGGFAFWRPTYRDSLGRTIHILPSSSQWAVGADLFAPVGKLDIMGEFIYLNEGTREAVDGYQLSPFTERIGALTGVGWYAQVGYWILGDQDIIGPPSYGRPIHVDLTKPQKRPQDGLQAMVKFEQLLLSYGGNSRGGALDSLTPNGSIDVDTFEVGVNYWATKHLRVGLNYSYYLFPSSAPTLATAPGGPVQSSTQRAVAPAQLLARGVDDGARDGAHDLHELQARVGVQF